MALERGRSQQPTTQNKITMTKKTISTLAAAATASLFATQASAINFDISSAGDSGMDFYGDSSFDFFSNTDGHVFEINDTDGAAGDAKGLFGSISGMWTIDPWAGNTTSLSGGPGIFSIMDEAGEMFTADIDFKKIGTVLSGGVINGSSNLTNFSYSGLNSDLGMLYAAGSATLALSFEMAGGPENLTLGHLAENEFETTFSGDLESGSQAVPDGGATAAMLGFGLLATAGVARRARKKQEQAA